MRSRRRLALLSCAVIVCVACVSRALQQEIGGLLATVRNKLSKEPDRDWALAGYLAHEAPR